MATEREPMAANAAAALILNVDDAEMARYAKSRILRHAGYEVIEAGTGADALALVRAQMPSVVLLDVKLPDLSGTEVCRLIKADPVTSTVLVLQTSATFVATSDRVRGLINGADGYLLQPAEPEELIANVQALLRLKSAEQRLRESEARLRETDRQKDRFLATLSHELRNPLSPILTAAELLGNAKLGSSEVSWAGGVIRRQGQHMARLLDDLLDLARITQGKLDLKLDQVSLTNIVDTAVEAVRPLLDRKQHRLTVALPAEPPIFEADPVRLSQVLTNLLANAAKYTNSSGQIDLRAHVDGATLVLEIQDNGIGIAPEAISAVFDMFSQANDARQRSDGGLGIGLALVKGLVELHGGSVQAKSAGPRMGSTFTVTLPIKSRDLPQAQDGAASIPSLHSRRLLIADDNRDAADSLALLLELAGHQVRVAYDGSSALALARVFRPEIAILDIGMPEMNGHAIARLLRQEAWSKGLRLVALTGWGQEHDKREAEAAGFHAHLTKPVDAAGLEALLARLGSAAQQGPSR